MYIFLWVVEIDVKNMYRGVLCFERRLVWIEKKKDRLGFVFNFIFYDL